MPIAHHSPKSFAKDNYISLENVLRGSGRLRRIRRRRFRHPADRQNPEHYPRRKYQGARQRSRSSLFRLLADHASIRKATSGCTTSPGECGKLSEYLEDCPGRNRGGAPEQTREAKKANLALLGVWLKEDPSESSEDLSKRFKEHGIEVSPITVRKYKQELRK